MARYDTFKCDRCGLVMYDPAPPDYEGFREVIIRRAASAGELYQHRKLLYCKECVSSITTPMTATMGKSK